MEVIERRTRLPVTLLVFSGYLIGASLGFPPRLPLRHANPIWWIIAGVFLAFVGRDRLLLVLRDVEDGLADRTTGTERWFDRVVKWGGYAAAVALIAAVSGAAATLAADAGLNIYLCVGIGIFLFIGLLGVVLSDRARTGP